ncbi:general stress protein [Metabacillus litoralis]|uniref:general stress protein n=1 Tax=Metabacillus litoralis TaxID=152268 RepID=UPI001CFE7480|nr:general stress protein [Metabacillus litoralis]
MKPYIEEYQNEDRMKEAVNNLKTKGVEKNDVYVLSHDDERTERISEKVDTNTIGSEETGMKNAVGNFFNKKGDELRNKLSEIGFSKTEAETYEEKLDKGKVLLIVTNPEKYQLV